MQQIPVRLSRRILAEIGVILVVPVVLLAIHQAFPQSTTDELYFQFYEPTVTSLWTGAMTHLSWLHVTSNITAYILLCSTLYLIFLQWEKRRAFWLLFAAILVLTPPLQTTLDYIILHELAELTSADTRTMGFSGVVGAFTGMLFVTLGKYVNDYTGTRVGYQLMFAVYLVAGVLLLVAFGVPTGSMLAAVPAIIIGFIMVFWSTAKALQITSLNDIKRGINARYWEFSLVFMSSAVLIGMIYTAFPADFAAGETTTNIVGHFNGLAVGLIITSLYFILSISTPNRT